MRIFEGFQHGVDFGGWLSQCDYSKERFDTFIVEDDFKKVSEWGLDHVRVPIDYNLIQDEEGNYKEDGFVYIDNAISWCEKYGLNMLLDLHKTYGYSFDVGEKQDGFFDNEAYQERFYKLWEKLATKYGNIGDRVAFELLNEVTDKETSDKWNEISKKCIERIRVIAPTVKILIGGYFNNSIEALPDLLPPYDENIVYNFHCYEPLAFTHQGAYWVATMKADFRISIKEPMSVYKDVTQSILQEKLGTYDGFDMTKNPGTDYFEFYLSKAVKLAEERNVALYCGEYGVINKADPEETLEWYKSFSEVFNKYNVGRAAWNYKEMDFGIIDEHLKDVQDEIIKCL
ncbi:MAG: glycoside hydrolase family 5 protein [Lachnospiraceae bacterium]|nr:glycoside hydrolase family 5 protein [Lachnospiraceae bacterium]